MKSETINTQFIFNKNDTVFINTSREENFWTPIKFKWIPVIQLKQE